MLRLNNRCGVEDLELLENIKNKRINQKNKMKKNKITFVNEKNFNEFLAIMNYWEYDISVEGKTVIFKSEQDKKNAIADAESFHWCEGCTEGGNANLYDKDGCYYCEKCMEIEIENEN